MNKNFYLVLSTLVMTTAINTIGTVAQAGPVLSGQQLPQPIADYPRAAAEFLQPSVTKISASGITNNSYFIRIQVAGAPVKRLIVSLPEQIERFDHLSVLDQHKHSIPVNAETTKQQVALTFTRPLENTAEISFNKVQLHNDDSATVLYRVSAQTVNASKEIVVGKALIKVARHS